MELGLCGMAAYGRRGPCAGLSSSSLVLLLSVIQIDRNFPPAIGFQAHRGLEPLLRAAA